MISAKDPRSGGLLHALYLLAGPARFDARPPTHAALRYAGDRPGVPPLCDVYVPEGRGPHPSVVLVHGGGFLIGHRRMKPVALAATRFAEAGIATCAIDYRLLLRGGGLDAQVADVSAAAAFWRDRCERFDCDAGRVSLLGFSAGATLMLLHAGESARPYHKVVSIYGATDFERVSGRRFELLLTWLTGTRDRRRWRALSPIARARFASPLLIVHGTRDALVPVDHARALYAERLAHGLPTELELVEGMPHGWLNDASLDASTKTLERVIEFFRA